MLRPILWNLIYNDLFKVPVVRITVRALNPVGTEYQTHLKKRQLQQNSISGNNGENTAYEIE